MADLEQKIVEDAKGAWSRIGSWLKKAVEDAWAFLMSFTQFLDGPAGKFSHKRLIGLACTVVALRQVLIGDWFAGTVLLATAAVLAVISAVTKT